MRPLLSLLSLALALESLHASAADLQFEFGPALFEKATDKPSKVDAGLGRRFTIEGSPSYDLPLYKGLWPMTIAAFRHQALRADVREQEFESPVKIKIDTFLLASADAHPIRDLLWPMTLTAFSDSDPFTFDIPFPR